MRHQQKPATPRRHARQRRTRARREAARARQPLVARECLEEQRLACMTGGPLPFGRSRMAEAKEGERWPGAPGDEGTARVNRAGRAALAAVAYVEQKGVP